MLDKSISAMFATIEVYNKPTFEYREDAYSILAVNVWELLLNVRILQIDNNKISSIIDEVDKVLAQHYGFTDEELDFIINYDIKYRMGKELDTED